MRQFQQSPGCFIRLIAFMRSFVAIDPQGVENAIDVLRQQAILLEQFDSIGVGVVEGWLGNSVQRQHIFYKGFPQHPQFDEAGIGVN